MKKLLVLIASVISLTAADLGVLYNDTNNLISPASLGISNFAVNTNLSLPGQIPNRALSLDNNSNVVSSSLSSLQQGYLASMIGNTNILYLGGTPVFSGAGNPTNGVVFTNISFYINSTAADISHTFYFSFGTNWLSLYSTNGGSITESQLNFSDVTTANSTTNKHGLLPKLQGSTSFFLRSDGLWALPANNFTPYAGSTRYLATIDPANNIVTYYDTGLYYNAGTLGVTNLSLPANGTIIGGANSLMIIDDISLTGLGDSVIGNVTISHHGFTPKGDGNSGHFLNGLGSYSTPASGVTGTITSTGSPQAGQVTFWSGTNSITGDSGFTYSNGTLTVTNISSHITVITNDATGNVTSGTYSPTIYSSTFSSGAAATAFYSRVGRVISVSGVITYIRGASGSSPVFLVSIPIGSSLSYFSWNLVGNSVQSYNVTGATVSYGYCSMSAPQADGNSYAVITTSVDSNAGSSRTAHFNFSYLY